MAERANLIWVDSQGEQVLHIIVTSTGVSSIRTALQAASNAVVTADSEGTNVSFSSTPTVATYPSVRTTARLNFVSASGSRGSLLLPAPQSSIFLTDGVTVDPTAITGIITAAVGNLLAGDSTLVTMFTGGELVATRFSGIASAQLFTP
jgi:hypothetical protein